MWTDSKQLELKIEYFLKILSVQHPGTEDLHVNFAKFSIVDKTNDLIFSPLFSVRNIVQILLLWLLISEALIHLTLQKRREATINFIFSLCNLDNDKNNSSGSVSGPKGDP